MQADPEVMQVESWLEQRRQRGFYEGGPTTEGDSAATPEKRPDGPSTDQQLVARLRCRS